MQSDHDLLVTKGHSVRHTDYSAVLQSQQSLFFTCAVGGHATGNSVCPRVFGCNGAFP